MKPWIAAMRASPNGPNPFVVGTDGVLRFLQVLDQCSQANFSAAASAGGNAGRYFIDRRSLKRCVQMEGDDESVYQ